MKIFKVLFVIICVYFLTISCGSGGGGGGGNGANVNDALAKLKGTWFGTLIDSTGSPYTITITLDASGNLTNHKVDGVPTNVTAKLTRKSDQLFSFVDSDGSKGVFAVDSNVIHGGFVTDDKNKGVLEKGASTLPTYIVTEINGKWSGNGFQLNTNMEVVMSIESNVSVTNYVFSVKDNFNTGFSGNFDKWIPAFGTWSGPYNVNVLGEKGQFTAILSPDKTFATTYSTNDFGGPAKFPVEYRFRFLSRQ